LATWRSWKGYGDIVAILMAVAVPLLIYTAFSDKHAKYLLPIYPFIAILLGKRLGELFEGAGPSLRRFFLAAGLLLPAGYAAFFAIAEARVFDYRIVAFPQFSKWLRTAPAVPLYGYKNLDERLIYYARREIPLIDRTSLQKFHDDRTAMLLLVENSRIKEIEPLTDCQVKTFTPYLKRDRSLAVFGLGAACEAREQ
jgi:hypothetical protein